MHLSSYLRSAATVIALYDGGIPLAAWLKNYFKQHKKFGSKDRKLIADLCYCFFRLGNAFAEEPLEERLLTAQYLCHDESPFVQELKPEWQNASTSVRQKLAGLEQTSANLFFPFSDEISDVINKESFALSHLVQPDLFLRIRPGKKEAVLTKLTAASIAFSVDGDCVRLSNNTKLDDVIEIDKEVVVQDRSSQRVLEPLQAEIKNQKSKIATAWDCCAASGGKSLLLHDAYPNIQLTVSDLRESILHNLKNRFKRAGVSLHQSFVADLSSTQIHARYRKYNLIICDAPCSGSGTWGRTPEQLRFFQKEKIEHYALLQQAIAVNASRHLDEGGLFLYITCSVFTKENEDAVRHITQQTNLKLLAQRYFKGYEEKADTLFVALFAFKA